MEGSNKGAVNGIAMLSSGGPSLSHAHSVHYIFIEQTLGGSGVSLKGCEKTAVVMRILLLLTHHVIVWKVSPCLVVLQTTDRRSVNSE